MFTHSELLPPIQSRLRTIVLALLFLAPFFFGFLALALGQDANWDLRNYHWYNAYAFLNGRYGFDLLPSQTPWFYNPTIDVPFYFLASHLPAKTVGFLLGFFQGLNFILIYMLAASTLILANPRQKAVVCLVLALVGIGGGGGLALLGTTFYDNVTSLGVLLSALLFIRNFEIILVGSPLRSFGLTIFYGFPAGLMMGLKLPSVIFCVGLCFSILLMPGGFRRLFLLSFGFGLGIILGCFVSLGPWSWFLWKHFQSPLFPYFNQVFQSPLAPKTSARDIQFIPTTWHDLILFPFLFAGHPLRVGEIPWRDYRIPALYALLPIAAVLRIAFGRSKVDFGRFVYRPASRYLLWVAGITYFVWLLLFSVYRYLVPLEMITPLLLVVSVSLLPLRNKIKVILSAVLIGAVVLSVRPGNWNRRASWSENYVEAKVPNLPVSNDLMILMAGFEPYSNLISSFPPNIPFIRIESNFVSPGEIKGINNLIKQRIESHKGPFMLLIPPWQHQLADEALHYYHLTLLVNSCQPVIDYLYDNRSYDLCSVNKEE